MKWICRLSLLALLMCASRAGAVGWGPTDFLIGGGPSFTDRIGVFDQNLNFKGYLETNFLTVAGMDFDSQGRLVAVAGALREVRVYDSSGARSGGFVRKDDLLGSSADLKVAPNGNYVVGTQNFGGGDGAREFAPNGTFVRQFGAGQIRGVAIVPGNRAWIGGIGSNSISVFDLISGAQVDTLAISGPSGFRSLSYSASTNTVLADSGGFIWEVSLTGAVIRSFSASGIEGLGAVTRGPFDDVIATDGSRRLLRWHPDGSFVGSVSTSSSLGGPYGIVWAGNVPEPSSVVVLTISVTTYVAARGRSRRRVE